MKYLLILLFLFSTHSFSGEIDGKNLICEWTKRWVPEGEQVTNYDSMESFEFYDGQVQGRWIVKNSDGFYKIRFSPGVDRYITNDSLPS